MGDLRVSRKFLVEVKPKMNMNEWSSFRCKTRYKALQPEVSKEKHCSCEKPKAIQLL